MSLNPARSNISQIICVTSVHESYISLFRSTTRRLREIGYFEKGAANDPKMTLNTTRWYVPLICVTSIHESKIWILFAAWSDVFEFRAILRQVHEMTINWPWTVQGQITLYMYDYFHRVTNFTPIRSMTSRFRDTGHSETSAPNGPKLTLKHTRSNYPIYV